MLDSPGCRLNQYSVSVSQGFLSNEINEKPVMAFIWFEIWDNEPGQRIVLSMKSGRLINIKHKPLILLVTIPFLTPLSTRLGQSPFPLNSRSSQTDASFFRIFVMRNKIKLIFKPILNLQKIEVWPEISLLWVSYCLCSFFS